MQRHICLLILLALAFPRVLAAEVGKTPAQYYITRPQKPVVIDGRLNEWNMAATPYTLSANGKNPLNSVHSNEPTNPVKDDADLSGRAALAWDDRYLYVAGEMTDDHLLGVKQDSAGNQGPPGWGCDSLMVALASYRQPMKTNTPYSPTPFLGLRYAPGPGARGKLVGNDAVLDKRDLYWILTANAKWAVTETPKGYNVEAAIPWADLNFIARPGERLFLSFLAADVDPDENLNQLGWGFAEDPKARPVFRLADREDMTGLLSVSLDEVPVDKPWAVQVELDCRKGAARLEKVRVVDAAGNTVLEQGMAMNVPQGMTGTEVLDCPAGAVRTSGRYTIEALAANGGAAAVVARLPVTFTEPASVPPLVKNAPGELHHMGPDRVAHNAFMEHREGFYRHGFVKSRDDYLPFIRRHVEPGLKGAVRQNIRSKNANCYRQALDCLAMHRITGDDEYAQLARDAMDVALESGDLGWFKLTGVAMYRYLTWKQDPGSPYAPKDAEKRYRAALCKVVANPSIDLFNESGTHNRVWHRYALLKIARMVTEEDRQPIDKRVIEYTDYHDKLIGEIGDADDASANYHWVFFDAAIGIYFHTGDWQAFLRNKGYQKTLSRYVEMVSPGGACPPFGSGNGWHMVGESMWAYEWMSTLTRDGRYRWTSHRIAEYYYNHLDPRANQYHLPYDEARNNFVLAYLLADDTVPPKPPAENSRATWRHPLAKVPLERLRARPGTSPMEMVDGWIPDKVVLSSGNDPQSLWGLVELLPVGGHTGELPGNIITLMAHDAALLAGQGYYENTPDFQNMLWIEDLDGLAADPRPITVEVPIFIDDQAFTFVRIRTTAYQHLPVTWTRDILFYKNGFMVVKDRAKFDTTMKVRLGPCFQARDLGPQCGDNWFNAYYGQLYYTGLGLGRGVQALRNPAWDLLVYFSPRPDRKHTVLDRYMENPYRVSPVQLRQSWSGMARAGQEITFTTVLLPHTPSITPAEFLPRIEVVRDDDAATVVKVVGEMDPLHQFRYETWLMLNDTGKPVTAGPLESDAQVAMIGHNYNGALQHRALAGGTLLRYRGNDETALARKYQLTPLALPAEFNR